MKTSLYLLAAVALGMALGCERKPAPPAEKPGIEVNAPGVKVDVEPGKGVEVNAPGVEVDTKKEK